MPDAAEAPAVLARVPEVVLNRVRYALECLAATRDLAAEARAWSGPVQARLILEDRAESDRRAREKLALFRRMAAANGVDAEAVILALGGEPVIPGVTEAAGAG